MNTYTEAGLIKAIVSRGSNPKALKEITIEHHYKDYEGHRRGLVQQLIEYINKNNANNKENIGEDKSHLIDQDYFLAGLDYFFKNNYKDALSQFKLALEKGFSDKDPAILSKIGACYIKLNNLEEAEKILTKSIEADEKYPTGYYNYGILAKKQREQLLSEGKYKEANKKLGMAINLFELAIEKVIEANDEDVEADNKYEAVYSHNNIATAHKDVYLYNGDEKLLDRAIERLEKLIKRSARLDDRGLTHYNLACFYTLKKDYKNAFKYLEASFMESIVHVSDSKSDVDLYNIKINESEQYKTLIRQFTEDYIKEVHKNVNNLIKHREIDKIQTVAIKQLENNLVKGKIANAKTYHLLGNCYALIGNKEKQKEYMDLYIEHMYENPDN